MNDRELKAMGVISQALDAFAEDERSTVHRILRWTCDRYGFGPCGGLDVGHDAQISSNIADAQPGDAAGLFHSIDPSTEAKKALVIGYWLQVGEGQTDFTAQEVNKRLKDLGHGIGNITVALRSLSRRKPALVMQTAKKGSAQQARKRYRLTQGGLRTIAG